jgi:hypothetical protein
MDPRTNNQVCAKPQSKKSAFRLLELGAKRTRPTYDWYSEKLFTGSLLASGFSQDADRRIKVAIKLVHQHTNMMDATLHRYLLPVFAAL